MGPTQRNRNVGRLVRVSVKDACGTIFTRSTPLLTTALKKLLDRTRSSNTNLPFKLESWRRNIALSDRPKSTPTLVTTPKLNAGLLVPTRKSAMVAPGITLARSGPLLMSVREKTAEKTVLLSTSILTLMSGGLHQGLLHV